MKRLETILSKKIRQQLETDILTEPCKANTNGHDELHPMTSAIIVVNCDGVVRFVSAAAETLLGRRRETLVGSQMGVPLEAGKATEMDIVRPDRQPLVAEVRAMRGDWEADEAWFLFLRDVSTRRITLEEAA